jgi:hypothetical protein
VKYAKELMKVSDYEELESTLDEIGDHLLGKLDQYESVLLDLGIDLPYPSRTQASRGRSQ